jgi:para-aminobenzoate synthetase component I
VHANAEPVAVFGDVVATGLLEITHEVSALDKGGWWAVVMSYEGRLTAARFQSVATAAAAPIGSWRGPDQLAWQTSLDESGYRRRVDVVRDRIAHGDVYQANLCRVLSAELPNHEAADVAGLAALLRAGNPAPFGGFVRVPEADLHIATASPELFLRVSGRQISSGPIKGTAKTVAGLAAKDEAENVMIVDLVRNDLARVCETGTIEVPHLLALEEHPGLVHLVSTVTGRLLADAGWPSIFAATFPPGSVTGAPKSSATALIAELEPVPRGPYCGAIGWVDADNGRAELAVGIRTFWLANDRVHFGSGAGITWGSDPAGEWRETELKAERLLQVASGTWQA